MRLHVKICGFTTPQGVEAAVSAGVDAIGLVLDPSPRQLSLEQALELKERIPSGIDVVAVCGRPSVDEVRTIQDVLKPDTIQLMADAVVSGMSGMALLPAFEDGHDVVDRVERYCLACRESRPIIVADGPEPGSGLRADWERVLPLNTSTRLIIAGGLTPENVGDAISLLKPYGVDVSSGVEAAVGRKDPLRIQEFVSAVRMAEKHLGTW